MVFLLRDAGVVAQVLPQDLSHVRLDLIHFRCLQLGKCRADQASALGLPSPAKGEGNREIWESLAEGP